MTIVPGGPLERNYLNFGKLVVLKLFEHGCHIYLSRVRKAFRHFGDIMIKLTILTLLTTFIDPRASLEQKACDHFFANIFRTEYPHYKVIEFDNQTDTTRYWGIVDKCQNWNDNTKRQILSRTPDKSTHVIATPANVRVKKRTKNSGRLKIGVWSKIEIGNNYFVLVGAYRKLRFAEYFFLLNSTRKEKSLGYASREK